MKAKYVLIFAASIGAITFLVGFFINAIYQDRLELLIIPSAVIALLSWFGSGSQILKLVKEWWEERQSKVKFYVEYDVERHPDQHIAKWTDEIGGYGTVEKRVLRIQVFNDSDGVAEKCRARFQILENNNKKYPEGELKFLRWAYDNDLYMTIGAHGDESLNILFSTDKKIHGMNTFVAHPDSINEHKEPRKKDGFEIDSHLFEVRIDPLRGQNARFRFRVDVSDDWDKVSMVKVR